MSRARFPHRRGSYVRCEAEVEIDVDEVLAQLSDDDLTGEMDSRNLERSEKWHKRNAPTIEELERVVDCLRRGWHQEALVRCERILDAATSANVPLSRVPELKARYDLRAAKSRQRQDTAG